MALASTALCAGLIGAGLPARAAPEAVPVQVSATVATETGPVIAPAKPGVYSATKQDAVHYRIKVTGRHFTSRDAIEKYLLYRAAELALQQHATWFTLVESRGKGDKVPAPKPNPGGLHYSFRMNYWRPAWRYAPAGAPAMKAWSRSSRTIFFADGKDAGAVVGFETSAVIVMQKGPMDDADPLAFEPSAVSDFLVNQVRHRNRFAGRRLIGV